MGRGRDSSHGGRAGPLRVRRLVLLVQREGRDSGFRGVGVQEADIVVKGGYTPDVIVVSAGKPVRLRFTRQETAACSEMVIFGDFGKSAYAPSRTSRTDRVHAGEAGRVRLQLPDGDAEGQADRGVDPETRLPFLVLIELPGRKPCDPPSTPSEKDT